MNKKNTLASGLIAILVVAIIWVLFLWKPAGDTPVKHSNLELTATPVGGDFTVEIQNGDLTLKDLRGKVVVLYFGYTQCPDICPTELSSVAQVLRSLDDKADQVKALFISIDPERDTPQKLKQYVPYYSPQLIGLTGTPDEVNKVADAYHVQRKIHPHNKNDTFYLVDHSANLFVLGPEGNIKQIIPFGLPVEHIQAIVNQELNKINNL